MSTEKRKIKSYYIQKYLFNHNLIIDIQKYLFNPDKKSEVKQKIVLFFFPLKPKGKKNLYSHKFDTMHLHKRKFTTIFFPRLYTNQTK